jgi:serine/threonine-protein kinase PpkA
MPSASEALPCNFITVRWMRPDACLMDIPGFKIEKLIGEGGMASVYLAAQQSLGRWVALKILKKFEFPEQAARFLDEGRLLAALNHQNIITIHDIGVVGERHFIAMEYLEGGSLQERIGAGLSPTTALEIVEQIGSCLDFVHRRGIIHRDVKPGNILFHTDGVPKLSDFGIAKQLDGDQERTLDGRTLGSPYYLSPEQAQNRPLDGRTDIYALGIVFYEMLVGCKPYHAASQVQTIMAHLQQPIPLLPPEYGLYQELLQRMIAKDPDDRFSSAGELVGFVKALRLYGDGTLTATGRLPMANYHPASSTDASVHSAGMRYLALGVAAVTIGAAVWWWQARTVEQAAALLPATNLAAVMPRESQIAAPAPATPVTDTPVAEAAQAPFSTPALGEEPTSPLPPSDTLVAASPLTPPDTDIAADPAAPQRAEADSVSLEAPVVAPPSAGLTMQQPAIVTTPIEQWLLLAADAVADYRLTLPADNNALYYYRQVLALDAGHAQARQGIDAIVDRYAAMAQKAIAENNLEQARSYLERGFGVRPDHPHLAAVEAEWVLAKQQAEQAEQSRLQAVQPPPALPEPVDSITETTPEDIPLPSILDWDE